jgi:hypothetical protein
VPGGLHVEVETQSHQEAPNDFLVQGPGHRVTRSSPCTTWLAVAVVGKRADLIGGVVDGAAIPSSHTYRMVSAAS